jgi:hypothetical protein
MVVAVTVTADMAMVVMAITVVMVMVAITVMVTGMAMERTITVMATTITVTATTIMAMATTTVIMVMDIGTTGTMATGKATDMATVGGGMGVGMVMGSEPAGRGRHMATSGFATSWQNKPALPNGFRRNHLGPFPFCLDGVSSVLSARN